MSNTHNLFTKLGRTPTMYLRSIPEHFIRYMGQKREELGVAVRNLVWQAGDFDVFYDLFGGSGAASIAIDKSPKKRYVYNELNKSVNNLMHVVKDDSLCRTLIENLKVLSKYLINGGQKYGSMDLQAELTNAGTFAKEEPQIQDDQAIIARGLVDSQTRAYAYFSYFMGVLDHPENIQSNRVEHAIAEVFRQSFGTRSTSQSSVLSTLRVVLSKQI